MVDFFDDGARPYRNEEASQQHSRASSLSEGYGLAQIKLEHMAEVARQAYISMLEPAETLLGMLAQIDEPSGGNPMSLSRTDDLSEEEQAFHNASWSLAGHILTAYLRADKLSGDYLRLADQRHVTEVDPISSELSVAADSVRAAIELHGSLYKSFGYRQILFNESNQSAADAFWEIGKTSFGLLKNTLEAFTRLCRAEDKKDMS